MFNSNVSTKEARQLLKSYYDEIDRLEKQLRYTILLRDCLETSIVKLEHFEDHGDEE